jgi:hypothetical protein
VLTIAYDNSGTSGADPYSSIAADTKGNIWTPRQSALYDPGAASAGVALRFFTCSISHFNLGDTVAITLSNAAAMAYTFSQVVSNVEFGRVAYLTGAAGTGANSGTPTVTTSSITSGDMVIGAGGAESANTWAGDADSTNGTWSTHQSNANGSGATGMSVTSQRKVVTATATQTYNPTLTSADQILAWISLDEVLTAMPALNMALLRQP